MKSLQGGFYFHPKDKNPSLGARLREKATRRSCHWVQLFLFCCNWAQNLAFTPPLQILLAYFCAVRQPSA